VEQSKQQKQAKDPQKEIEIALAELEERVERLRTLYEQYFMGFEKIEPGVARKEVDRRFMLLRKAQIRNTALRFRFNVVTQKFNTYAMYWTRICRQIEEGTYKRHVARAARRFGAPNRPNRDDTVEVELDLEVELGDFEDVDMEALLAEVDAEAAAYGRGDVDTVPPQAPSDAPQAAPLPAPAPPAIAAADLEIPRSPVSEERPASGAGARVGRPVALPPGAKPRVLVRKTNPNGDRAALDAPPSSKHGPISTSSIRPSPQTGVVSPAAESSRNVLAAPAAPTPAVGFSPRAPTSERKLPLASPAAGFTPRSPVSTKSLPDATPTPAAGFAPTPLPSERKLPAGTGGLPTPAFPMSPRAPSPAMSPGAVPAIRPIGPKTPPSPMRPAGPLEGAAKSPAAPVRTGEASVPRTPQAAPLGGTPGSVPRTPNAPLRPAPAEPRPKNPPPLPSQLKKP
jgi:hypothetical protein